MKLDDSILGLVLAMSMLGGVLAVDCDKVEMYDSPWFINNACAPPAQSKCLFYGPRMGVFARRFAFKTALTTIWDIWPPKQYSWSKPGDQYYEEDPMRCIMNNDIERVWYFGNMSRAMAALCDQYAQLMVVDPFKGEPKIGLFADVEYPALKDNPYSTLRRVDKIDLVWINGDYKYNLWQRSKLKREDIRNTTIPSLIDSIQHEVKSLHSRGACGVPLGREKIFDDCGIASVPW